MLPRMVKYSSDQETRQHQFLRTCSAYNQVRAVGYGKVEKTETDSLFVDCELEVCSGFDLLEDTYCQ